MATWSQHKILNGVLIPQFLDAVRIGATKENVLAVKKMFKQYLDVASTSLLSERDMWKFIQAFQMLSAREFGVELPENFAEKTMEELLNHTTNGYEKENQ